MWAPVGEMGEGQHHLALASTGKSSDLGSFPRLGKLRQRTFQVPAFWHFAKLHSSPNRLSPTPGVTWVWTPLLLGGSHNPSSHLAQPVRVTQGEGMPGGAGAAPQQKPSVPETCALPPNVSQRTEAGRRNCRWQGSRCVLVSFAICHLQERN